VNATSTSEIVTAADGFRELRRRWRSRDPWASAVLIHGAAEHSGLWELVGARLSSAGIDTHGFDLRGCGASGGRRADIEDWTDFLRQVRDNLVPLLSTDLPVMLLGHSLGGLIAVEYALSDHPQPDLVVLHAPAVGNFIPAWQRRLAPLLARLAPRMTFANWIDLNRVFTDPATVDLHRADPLRTTRTTARLAALLLEHMERAGRSVDQYNARTLVLHGAADHLVPLSATKAIGDLPSVDRKTYPGIRHGTIIEPQGMGMVDDIVAWVQEQTTRGGRQESLLET